MATVPHSATILINGNLGFYSALTHVKPESSEGPVQMLWYTICTSIFSVQQGYLIADKSTNTSERDLLVTEVQSTTANPRDSGDMMKRQVFRVKCKASYKDTPEEWAPTDYLEQVSSPSDRIYAAIAIGTKVKFYRWDKSMTRHGTQLEELHTGTIDICHEAHRAEQYMLEIKRQAWDWAGRD